MGLRKNEAQWLTKELEKPNGEKASGQANCQSAGNGVGQARHWELANVIAEVGRHTADSERCKIEPLWAKAPKRDNG